MSTIKSYSVGVGDMFTIDHNSDNFTIIDCCLEEDVAESILAEVARLGKPKGITRFISTHPDEDHILGLERLDDKMGLLNFYVVANSATKKDETESFKRYCALRDSQKSYAIENGCQRKWMNLGDNVRDASGLNVLWPKTNNPFFKEALAAAAKGEAFNNISPVLTYSLNGGVTALWMGDMEADFMEAIEDDIDLPRADVLFAPHHGRDSGKVPESMLAKIKPKLIVVGEAPSAHLNYYPGYNTVTQNSAGDIIFDCIPGKCHVFTSEEYEVDFLTVEPGQARAGLHYIGTLKV